MRNPSGSKQNDRVRYALVGLGPISQHAILPAFAQGESNSQLTALVSGDPKKLHKLSREFKVERTYSYEQFGDCLNSGEIDAVYVALPNNMHRVSTESAALAGIHVLCEKPMSFDEAECEAMIRTTETAGVKLMIGYGLHFERANLQAVDILKSGKIGEPRIFTSVFSRQAHSGCSRVKKDVAGRAIYDLGINCINAARYFFGAEPLEVFAWNMKSDDSRFNDVPQMTSSLLRFSNDRMASFTVGFRSANCSALEVIGTKGILKMDHAFGTTEDFKSEIEIKGWKVREIIKRRDIFASQIKYFSDCILNNKQPEPSAHEALADLRVIRALLQSIRTNRPVPLPQPMVTSRASSDQHMFKHPIVRPPHLVSVASASAV